MEYTEIPKGINSVNTMKSLFARVDFDDTVKLINVIPDLEQIALKKYNKHKYTLLWAVYHNKLHVVKWVCEHDFEHPSEITLETAAKRGHLEILIWLLENTEIKCTQRTMDIAACNGQSKVAKWIHENTDIKATKETIEWANEEGYYTLAIWLQENTESLHDYSSYNFGGNMYNFLKKKITSLYK